MASRNIRIGLKDESLDVMLAWSHFDGDDCFEDFRITVTPRGDNVCTYEFGPCAVHAVRKMKHFLSDTTQPSVSGGFRYPDIRTYAWHRVGPKLKLVVKFEGNHFEIQHDLTSPAIVTEEEPYSYEPKA